MVQNAIVNGQGNKLKMYVPSYDVLPQTKRPECVKMSLDIPVFDTASKRKKESKGSASVKHNSRSESAGLPINQVLLLTSREQEEFNSEYRTLPHENSKLSLAKFTYRQVLPMPRVHLPRTSRCLDFCSLISSVETMISEEETHIQVSLICVFLWCNDSNTCDFKSRSLKITPC
jgi:hypothetical protein